MRVNADMPPRAAAKRVQIGDDPVEQGEDVPEMHHQGFSGRRRFDTTVMAKQQGNATAGFQFADAAAERRQREVLPGGGTGQTSFLHRGDKYTKGHQIQTERRPGRPRARHTAKSPSSSHERYPACSSNTPYRQSPDRVENPGKLPR